MDIQITLVNTIEFITKFKSLDRTCAVRYRNELHFLREYKMKKLITKILKKRFLRNVFIIATGTAAAQIITILSSPFITRLYGPEAFGVLGAFTAVISLIMPIAALTYPIAIVLPKEDNEAKNIAKLSIFISISIAIVTTFILMFFNHRIVDLFNIETVSSFMFLIPIVIIFSGVLQVIEQWFIRKKKFKVSANATFFQSVLVNGGKIGLGLVYPVAAALVIITVISQLLKSILLFFFAKMSRESLIDNEEKKRNSYNLQGIAKKYKDFPLYRAPETFLNAISQGLPILMLSTLFGTSSAGFYTLGRSVLSAPTQLLGKAVADVFYPRISDAFKNRENLYLLIKKSTLLLAVVGAIPFGLIILFSPYVFGAIFGQEWETAGEYTRWIAIWSYIGFLNRPSVAAIPVLSAQRFFLQYSIASILLRIVALALGYLVFTSDLVAIALFSLIGALSNIFLISYTLKRSKNIRFD